MVVVMPKLCECPKCGTPSLVWGMSGNPQSDTYFICHSCNVAWYWVNRKGRVLFSDDEVTIDDDLYIYNERHDPNSSSPLAKIGWVKQEFNFVLS